MGGNVANQWGKKSMIQHTMQGPLRKDFQWWIRVSISCLKLLFDLKFKVHLVTCAVAVIIKCLEHAENPTACCDNQGQLLLCVHLVYLCLVLASSN